MIFYLEPQEKQNYINSMITTNPQSHICPVCGKYRFSEYNSYEVCPFCGWEDDTAFESTPDVRSSANHVSLNDYRKNYARLIENDDKYIWYCY